MKKNANRKEDGYISFDPEELKNTTQEGHPNDEAYELLWKATCVSSHINDEAKESGSVESDDIYPTSTQEVDSMEEYLNQAEAALKEPDQEFSARINELREVVQWSRKRHWKLNWRVVVGVIISIFTLHMWADSRQGDVNKAEEKLVLIKNWKEAPIKRLDLTSLEGQQYIYSENPFTSMEVWYDREQRNVAHYYYTAIRDIAYNEEELKKPDLSDELKDFYKGQIKKSKKKKEELLERFEDLQKADFGDIQEMATEAAEEIADEKRSDARFVKFWNIFFLLLIPLYIFAARPHGYTISRYRREADRLGWVERIGLWLSGSLLTAGMGIGFVDIVTKWSDGSTTRSDDGTGPMRLALKVGLFLAAVAVFCAVSCFLMLYATISGLIRNYNWTNIKNKVVDISNTAAEQIRKK